MRPRSRPAGQRWQSFHVFLPRDFDEFLAEYVSPMVERELNAGRVRRFFFIRYSEGGNHLRLRFLLESGTSRDMVVDELDCLTRRFAGESGLDPECCYVLEEAYDRVALYFGETLLSVYSELLNEQTSYLALRVLRTGYLSGPGYGRFQRAATPKPVDSKYPSRLIRLLTVGSILALLTRRVARSSDQIAGYLDESCRFALEALGRMGASVSRWDRAAAESLQSALNRSIPKFGQLLDADYTAERIAVLLRRMRKHDRGGASVAVHGLHLLCNKLGVSLNEEHELFAVLHRQSLDRANGLQGL